MNWTKTENILSEKIDRRTLLVDAGTGARWTLNSATAALWQLCDGKTCVTQLVSVLRMNSAQINAYCEALSAQGLLQPVSVSASTRTLPDAQYFSVGSAIKPLGLGSGPRRRPTPRGVSGPG